MSVALANLDSKGIDTATADMITNRLRTELANTGFFTVVERSAVEEAFTKQGLVPGSCISDECAVKTGKLLGVENMITGTIDKTGDAWAITIHLLFVATGRVLLMARVDHLGSIDEVLANSMAALAHKFVAKIEAVSVAEPVREEQKQEQQVVETGTLAVTTDPQGARVLLNKVEKGLTPYKGSNIEVGVHTLEVKLRTYITIEKSIRVSANDLCKNHFKLEHTTTYLESEKASKRMGDGTETDYTKTTHIWPKVVFGIITVACGAVGAVINIQAEEKVNDYMAIKVDYSNSNGNADYDTYSKDFKVAWNEADRMMKIRNICYIASGVGLACFAVTFAF